MIDTGPLHDRITAGFDGLSPQLQVAARFVLDQPGDVALLSMRAQARRAGVPPATMTRLAQKLGMAGYDDVRALYAQSLRRGTDGFADRATDLVDRHKDRGEAAIAVEVFQTASDQIGSLIEAGTLEAVSRAAAVIASARRVYVAGQRSSYPVAYQFAYMSGLIGCDSRLLDAPGGIGIDGLHDAEAADVLLVVSIRPYAREALKLARYAKRCGMPVVAITDSQVSPFARLARIALVAGVESPSFFHTMAPAFAIAEAISALTAVARSNAGRDALSARERHFETLDLLLTLHQTRKPRTSDPSRE